MPTLEALERKRERKRAWDAQRPPRTNRRKADIWTEDEHWFTLTCSSCQRLFDVPRVNQRLREKCEECR